MPSEAAPVRSAAHTSGQRRRQSRHLDWLQVGFFATMAVWLLIPFGAASGAAQDAVAYTVAGRLVAHHPEVVYPEPPDPHSGIHERFKDDYCAIVGVSGARCDGVVVAYLATPLAIPFAVAIGHTSGLTGSLLMRLGAAAMLVVGLVLLWRRLGHRTRYARLQLLVVALALTPMATTAIGFGQTSPLMFLSVCLGLGATTRAGKIVSVVVWVGACIFKMFPTALVLVLAWLRRWRFLGAAAAMFAVAALLTLPFAPLSIVGDFIGSSATISGSTIHGSVDALTQKLLGDGGVGSTAGRLASIGAAIACCWAGCTRTRADVRWAAGYVALLLLSPLVQLHYLWVPLGAVAIALAAQRRIDDRYLGLFTILSVLTIPPSLVPDPTKGAYPTYQALLLIVTAAVFGWLAIRSRTPQEGAPSPIRR
jgi:hypothetical protein